MASDTTGRLAGPPVVTIRLEGEVSMSVSDLWPDGDAPEVVTAKAVAALMRDDGSKSRVLADWCLINELEVTVDTFGPNPAWRPEKPMFGERPARTLRTTCVVDWAAQSAPSEASDG